MRIDHSPADLPAVDVYRLLTNLVIPRPIAWVSSMDGQGRVNLAPHSFFTVASADPGIVQFTSVRRKDTLRNVEATGEFTVNFTPRRLLEHVNATGTPFPHGVDEFAKAGLTPEPSTTVAPPRVAESPAAIECALERVVPVGDSFLVLGLVRHIAVDRSVLDAQGRPDPSLLDPLARLGGSLYGTLGETPKLRRMTVEDYRAPDA